MEKYKVSVVVCIYNSELDDLIKTLNSIIMQRGIDFEIIITDDGSKKSYDHKEYIVQYMEKRKFVHYQFIEHKENKGTVYNIYDGLMESSGEYVYTISPGDYFYDTEILYRLYNFACENRVDFCFGEAVYYIEKDGRIELMPTQFPKLAQVYLPVRYNKLIAKVAYFSGQHPVGATYFRKRKLFLKYMKMIVGKIKYLEDYPTTGLYLLENKRLYFYGEPVVFYKYGSGVSTSKNVIWKKRLQHDIDHTKNVLLNCNAEDRILCAKYAKNIYKLKYPLICIIGMGLKVAAMLKRLKVDSYDIKLNKYHAATKNDGKE